MCVYQRKGDISRERERETDRQAGRQAGRQTENAFPPIRTYLQSDQAVQMSVKHDFELKRNLITGFTVTAPVCVSRMDVIHVMTLS